MQPLDPSGLYGADAVRRMLTGQLGARTWAFRYERLDATNKVIGDVTGSVVSCSVSNDSLADIKRTAKFSIIDNTGINFLTDHLRPWARLAMPDGGYVEWPLGVFLMSSPARKLTPSGTVTRDIDAYDQLQILKSDAVTNRYTVAAGALYTDAIVTLLATYTFTLRLVPSTLALPGAMEWDPGTTILQVLNDLLGAINYRSATFDELGTLVLQPYVTPATRSVEYAYADDAASVLTGDTEQDLDLFNVPNSWTLVMSEPDQAAPLTATYINSNPLSPTSTVSRGRTIPKVITESTAADATTLLQLATNQAFSDSQVYETIKVGTALMPIHSDSDVYSLGVSALGISNKYSETSWDMSLAAGAVMNHSIRRVVNV